MLHVTDPGPERARLGFAEAVLFSFAFLRGYGLKPVQQEPTFVRYESNTVFVNVYHGRASYEIGAELGRLDRQEKYGLTYIVAWAGKDAWEREGLGRHTMFQVSSREGVQEFVPKVAKLVEKYGEPFLRGDPRFYDQLDEDNKREVIAYKKRQWYEDIRKKAETAWSEKNYAKIVELYGSMQEDLTPVEAGRLSYAAKHAPASHGVQ